MRSMIDENNVRQFHTHFMFFVFLRLLYSFLFFFYSVILMCSGKPHNTAVERIETALI